MNDDGLVSIHYAIKLGRVDVLEAMVNSKAGDTVMRLLQAEVRLYDTCTSMIKVVLNDIII